MIRHKIREWGTVSFVFQYESSRYIVSHKSKALEIYALWCQFPPEIKYEFLFICVITISYRFNIFQTCLLFSSHFWQIQEFWVNANVFNLRYIKLILTFGSKKMLLGNQLAKVKYLYGMADIRFNS